MTWPGSKTTRKTIKSVVWLEKLKTTCFFKHIETTTYWINPGQLGLTCQIHDSNHKTMITPKKANSKTSSCV